MSYHLLTYSMLFLPIVMLLYQISPKKGRPIVMLGVNFVFFYMISGMLIIYFIVATLITYFGGRIIAWADEKYKKQPHLVRNKRIILGIAIVLNLSMLVVFKYLRMFGVELIAPVGISYYTLQTISYMTDVYRGTVKADRNPLRLTLYLSFFPQIMEGPISRYSEVAPVLYEGNPIKYENVVFGYQRILWGLFKKMMVADRLALVVSKVYGAYQSYDGAAIFVASIAFTSQLYMEFSGCIDIVIGTGEIFGVKLPENFRQPFFASSASDFWRRWHITLGTWLKDYVFYPVSLAKPVKNVAKKFKKRFGLKVSKFVAPSIALFAVWTTNGIWHGAGATYLFYGMYYFVIIFLENITEEPFKKLGNKLGVYENKILLATLRGIKLFIIVVIGEMFFRAPSLSAGFDMFGRIFGHFNIRYLGEVNFGIGTPDGVVAFLGTLVVLIVDILHEKGIRIREKIASLSLPVRWGVWYAAIAVIIIFGAYGVGYTVVDMIYAAY